MWTTTNEEEPVAVQNPMRVDLGKSLRDYRMRAGLKTGEVERHDRLGWYAGRCSRVETGTRVPTTAETHVLADLYGLTEAERADLIDLAERARKRVRMAHVPDWAQSAILLEQDAREIDYHDAELIPALLQAPGYARDLLGQNAGGNLDQRVEERLVRGQLLARTDAPRVRVVLGEAALHRLPRDRAAARQQLEYLLEVGSWPAVEIRVLPFALGLHPMVGQGFMILRLREPDVTRAYLEGATTATYLHEPDDTAIYDARFERLWALASPADESATIVRERISQLG